MRSETDASANEVGLPLARVWADRAAAAVAFDAGEVRAAADLAVHRRSQPGAADGAGADALTQRELEIARRIVDCKTNRQIAEELFLSRKTVETHIRNIFAKLGADSRVEVARMVERAERLSGARA